MRQNVKSIVSGMIDNCVEIWIDKGCEEGDLTLNNYNDHSRIAELNHHDKYDLAESYIEELGGLSQVKDDAESLSELIDNLALKKVENIADDLMSNLEDKFRNAKNELESILKKEMKIVRSLIYDSMSTPINEETVELAESNAVATMSHYYIEDKNIVEVDLHFKLDDTYPVVVNMTSDIK